MAKKRESKEEREKKGGLKIGHKKTENQRETHETHEWGINSTSQNVPRGHDAYGTVTTH